MNIGPEWKAKVSAAFFKLWVQGKNEPLLIKSWGKSTHFFLRPKVAVTYNDDYCWHYYIVEQGDPCMINFETTPINIILGKVKPRYLYAVLHLGFTCKVGTKHFLRYQRISKSH